MPPPLPPPPHPRFFWRGGRGLISWSMHHFGDSFRLKDVLEINKREATVLKETLKKIGLTVLVKGIEDVLERLDALIT